MSYNRLAAFLVTLPYWALPTGATYNDPNYLNIYSESATLLHRESWT